MPPMKVAHPMNLPPREIVNMTPVALYRAADWGLL
jgi:hypothetical protein